MLTSEDFHSDSHDRGAVGFMNSDSPSDGPLIDITESPLTQLVLHNNLAGVQFPVLGRVLQQGGGNSVSPLKVELG